MVTVGCSWPRFRFLDVGFMEDFGEFSLFHHNRTVQVSLSLSSSGPYLTSSLSLVLSLLLAPLHRLARKIQP
jgi:hypothetical protein